MHEVTVAALDRETMGNVDAFPDKRKEGWIEDISSYLCGQFRYCAFTVVPVARMSGKWRGEREGLQTGSPVLFLWCCFIDNRVYILQSDSYRDG